MPESNRPAAYDLGPLAPASDDEAASAARAVHEQRKYGERRAAADALTPRERALIEAAYAAGSTDALKKLMAVVGVAAVTVDAATLRALTAPGLDARRPWHGFGPSAQLIDIVGRALQLEELHREPEGDDA